MVVIMTLRCINSGDAESDLMRSHKLSAKEQVFHTDCLTNFINFLDIFVRNVLFVHLRFFKLTLVDFQDLLEFSYHSLGRNVVVVPGATRIGQAN